MDSDLFSSSNGSTSPGEPSPLKCHLHAINGGIHTKAISAIITVFLHVPEKNRIGYVQPDWNKGTQKIHSITHTWPRTLDRKQITRNNNCLVSNDRLGKVVASISILEPFYWMHCSRDVAVSITERSREKRATGELGN